mgnify:CR=1 FL=1
MTDRYLTITTPAKKLQADVSSGASATPANWFDLRVTYDATGASKQALLDALEAVENKVALGSWPPA